MKGKIIFHGFVLLLFLVLLQRIIVTIRYRGEDLGKGVIYDNSSYKRSVNSATTYTYFIIDKNGKKYEDGGDSETNEFGFSIGDLVTFRKLHNGDSKSVRMIKRNGEQVRNYYDFVDYASVIGIIVIILGYILIPRLLKK